jgi:F420-dependent methylenetetrahydromethanopterin dehydrogenase
VKRQVENGTPPHSWGKEFVKSCYQKYEIDELSAIYAGYLISRFSKLTTRGRMSETTNSCLNSTLLGLLSNPGALRVAQEELDRVVGSDRTPALDDEPNLPFVREIGKVRSH